MAPFGPAVLGNTTVGLGFRRDAEVAMEFHGLGLIFPRRAELSPASGTVKVRFFGVRADGNFYRVFMASQDS